MYSLVCDAALFAANNSSNAPMALTSALSLVILSH
jgi:hypothetical protein